MQPYEQLNELEKTKRLRSLVNGGWTLEHEDRYQLGLILGEWITILEDERKEGAA